MERKLLYVASTAGHLKSFHLPYIRALKEDGWTVHIAGRGADAPLAGADAFFDIPFEKSMTSPQNLTATAQLSGLIRREKYDVISVHTSLAAFFVRLGLMASGRRGKTLMINTVHGYLFDEDTKPLKRSILLGAEKLTTSATDLLLTMNAQDTRIAQKHRLCRGAVEQIDGMGVDFGRFVPADEGQKAKARESFGIPADAFVLVYAAEFSKRKNQSELICALKDLPENVCLLLAGRGGLQEQCQALCRELGVEDRVFFAGFVSDVERCYQAADVCVSTSRSEGLPFNLMEAMHCALPVVATAVKGHEDLVENGFNGFLFPFDDRAALCRHIRSLQDDRQLRARMGQNSLQSVERYELAPVLRENMDLLRGFFRQHGLESAEKVPAGK